MLAIKIALVLTLLVSRSDQQDASMKCESDPVTSSQIFYPRYLTMMKKCEFSFVKSQADVDRARAQYYVASKEQVISIIFSNSSLSQLPDKMLSGFTGVKKLDASRLTLSEITATAFVGPTALEIIDLSNNYLETVPERTFATMKLKLLDLSYNLIATIDEKAFLGTGIEKLDISFNKLKTIQFLNSFNYFDVLQMNNNLLESFKLEVKKDGFAVPRGVFFPTGPPKLFLQNNKFTKFDCSSSIRIASVELSENAALSEIALNDCDIDNIDVGVCPSLKKVTLNEHLYGFAAHDVKLGDLSVNTAKSLRSLSLRNTSLTPGVIDSITQLENLTVLDLSYNNVGALSESTFAKLKVLRSLSLKATNISNIVFGTFSHQHAVEILDISDNNLGYFDMNMIFSMNTLTSLDISGNALESLKNVESAHFTFTALAKIDMSNNNWACSYLMKIIKILRVYKVALARSNLEESGTNIHGIKCVHHEGDDNIIEPLTQETKNITEIRDKMNELIEEVGKNTLFKNSIESRMMKVENKVDNQVISFSALKSEKSQPVEVKNSAVLETSLTIISICLMLFIAIKLCIFIKRNFISRAKSMSTYSERHLAMTVDDF